MKSRSSGQKEVVVSLTRLPVNRKVAHLHVEGTPLADRKSDRTRRKILDSAAKILCDRGYSRTRLSDVVESLGIRPASIYYHFASKDALIEEVLQVTVASSMRFVQTCVENLPSSATPLDKLIAAVLGHSYIAIEHGDYLAASIRVLRDVPGPAYDAFMIDRRKYADFMEVLLAQAQKAGEIRTDVDIPVLRALLVAAIGWRLEWHTKQPPSPQNISDQVLKSFVEGIVAQRFRARVFGRSRDLGRIAVQEAVAKLEQ